MIFMLSVLSVKRDTIIVHIVGTFMTWRFALSVLLQWILLQKYYPKKLEIVTMLNFPQEILNAKKTITIAVDENDELIFSTDNQPGEEWKPWELYGAIQFAAQTFGLPTSQNEVQGDTAPNTVQDEDIPQQLEMDLSFLHEEEGQQFEVEQLKSKRNQYQATHGHESYKNVQVQSVNYSGDYPWLK